MSANESERIAPHAESGFGPVDVLAEAEMGHSIELELDFYDGSYEYISGTVQAVNTEAVTTMAEDLERLRKTGLSDEDARDLIYGRNSGLTKTEIEALFGAIDDVRAGTTGSYDPIERLLADLSDLSLSETTDLMDELDRLQRRYGGDSNGE